MNLREYGSKRSFKHTPEPRGRLHPGKKMEFVVQKHDASSLHYDFRLSIGGVLKSWAIPKGPSMNPKLKRLALMVEDHPYDYKNFEGVIPQGNYGAGTVMVWDSGTFRIIEETNGRKTESGERTNHLEAGKIKFRLDGKKLRGNFVLWRTGSKTENKWLLKKMSDEFATTEDVLDMDRSVISNKTLDELADTRAYDDSLNTTGVSGEKNMPSTNAGKRSTFPGFLSPMLATLVKAPVGGPDWLYEMKWDGYRAIAYVDNGNVDIRSRNNKSFNQKFYPIARELEQWDASAVVDGEVVVINSSGFADFGALQNWRSEADGQLIYIVFDLLFLEGDDLRNVPLTRRRRLLKKALPQSSTLRFSESFDSSGKKFFSLARKMGLEGIIAKKKDSVYQEGKRSGEWLKIKTNKRQEVVIGGFTRNANTSKLFSALLVGVYSGNRLHFTGKVGTGFTEDRQRELMKQFRSLVTKTSPFQTTPDVNRVSRFRPVPKDAAVTWLRPKLVGEVSFTELTKEGLMRHPSFIGLREDKAPKDVKFEKALSASALKRSKSELEERKLIIPPDNELRKSLLNPSEETQVKNIKGHNIRFSNLSKVFWPQQKITKRDLINFYYQIAPYIMPYIKDRPQSLNRHPNGIKGKSFFQKDVTGKVPDWVSKHPYRTGTQKKDKHFLVCSGESELLYMVSLGCIEINPWSSRTQRPDNPDWCIIDIDPGNNSFDKVISVAQIVHDVLNDMNVPGYCKTSGSTGMHVYIPLGGRYSYHQSKEFARAVATLVQREMPRTTTLERTLSKRRGRIYLDFLQNRLQATVAAPYSVRPKPGAPVSMPLHWDEVRSGLRIQQFNLHNCLDRIREVGDIFQPVLGKGVKIEKAIATSPDP